MGSDKNFNMNSIDVDGGKTSAANNRQDQFIDDNLDDDYEEGEVSGYVVQKPLSHSGTNLFNPNLVSKKALSEIFNHCKISFQNVLQADPKSGNFVFSHDFACIFFSCLFLS